MDEGDTRFLNAEGMTHIVHIVNLLAALGIGRHRDDGGIGEEEQLLVFGNLSHGDMGEHMARTQDTRLTIEDGPQDDIGIDQTLHQDVGLATLTESHSPTGAFFLIVTIDIDGFDESHLLSFFYGVTGTGIIGADDGHALLITSLLEEHDHVVEVLYRLHK